MYVYILKKYNKNIHNNIQVGTGIRFLLLDNVFVIVYVRLKLNSLKHLEHIHLHLYNI